MAKLHGERRWLFLRMNAPKPFEVRGGRSTSADLDFGWPEFDNFSQETIGRFRREFVEAAPFPHLVVDHLFPSGFLSLVEAGFEEMKDGDWQSYGHALQTKRGSRPNISLPSSVQAYFDRIYSGSFLRLLSKITNVPNLIPDPSLVNGGMHEVGPGGRFDIHVDFRR